MSDNTSETPVDNVIHLFSMSAMEILLFSIKKKLLNLV